MNLPLTPIKFVFRLEHGAEYLYQRFIDENKLGEGVFPSSYSPNWWALLAKNTYISQVGATRYFNWTCGWTRSSKFWVSFRFGLELFRFGCEMKLRNHLQPFLQHFDPHPSLNIFIPFQIHGRQNVETSTSISCVGSSASWIIFWSGILVRSKYFLDLEKSNQGRFYKSISLFHFSFSWYFFF